MAKPIPTQPAPTVADEPRLGATVHVVVAPGMRLRNNETGADFAPGLATPVTVSVTLLRRLRDGDLALA